jgi:hypothetical protein
MNQQEKMLLHKNLNNPVQLFLLVILLTASALLKTISHIRIINGVAVPSDFPVIETHQYNETAPGCIFFSSIFFNSDSRSNYMDLWLDFNVLFEYTVHKCSNM